MSEYEALDKLIDTTTVYLIFYNIKFQKLSTVKPV